MNKVGVSKRPNIRKLTANAIEERKDQTVMACKDSVIVTIRDIA